MFEGFIQAYCNKCKKSIVRQNEDANGTRGVIQLFDFAERHNHALSKLSDNSKGDKDSN